MTVGGKAGASSPAFAIAPAGSLYARAAGQRAVVLRERARRPAVHPLAAALGARAPQRRERERVRDAAASTRNGAFKGDLTSTGETIDASGGWWDAGDYLKFVQTTSYTVDLLLAGVRDFPAQMGASSPGANFTAEARFGAEWLLRMFDDRTGTLYYQVGIGEGNSQTLGDHDIWRLPQADDSYGGSDPSARYIRHRPVFRAGAAGLSAQPQPRRTRRRRVRALLPGLPRHASLRSPRAVWPAPSTSSNSPTRPRRVIF